MSTVITEEEDRQNGQANTLPEITARDLENNNNDAPRPPRNRRRIVLMLLLLVVLVAAIAAIAYFIRSSRYESTDDAFIEGRVIPISPQVAARVLAVHVDDNQRVKRGDPLVDLDPTDYQVALDQAKANEAAMQGKLEQAKAQATVAEAAVEQAQAEVNVVQANAENAAADYKRYQELSARSPGAVSHQQMDATLAELHSTTAQVEQAKAKLAAARAQIQTAQATIRAAQGDLDKSSADRHRAEVDLGYCRILAPEPGTIARKNVEPGSYVQLGQAILSIVPADVWVVANFKETQLDKIHPGEPVKISVDAYPGHEFTGKVDSIQSGTGSRFSMLPAENATGNFVHVVQRVPVKILFDPGQTDDPSHPLAPGMSVEPEVDVK